MLIEEGGCPKISKNNSGILNVALRWQRFSQHFFPFLYCPIRIAYSWQHTADVSRRSSEFLWSNRNSFTKHLYHLYKGFEFRSLWDVNTNLVQFERTASEAAPGTGMLQGALQLNMALEKVDSLTNKGRQCFTRFRHTTNTHKWSFNNVSHAAVSMCFVPISICTILYLCWRRFCVYARVFALVIRDF